MRLPAKLRIKQGRDFARQKSEGEAHPGRFMVLSVRRQEGLASFQFGLITTRKIGNAVVRSRIRRLLREVVRDGQSQLQPGIVMVIIARWRAPEASLAELKADWLKLARRAKILIPTPPPSP